MLKYKVDLRRFGGEKTEEATPKKRQDARKKGQVVQSKDIAAAISLLAVFVLLSALSTYYFEELFAMLNQIMVGIGNIKQFNGVYSYTSLWLSLTVTMFKLIMPPILIALIIGVGMSYAQVGVLFTMEPLKFKFDKLNPISGFKRLFSLKSLIELAKSLIKGIGVVYLAYAYIVSNIGNITQASLLPLSSSVSLLWDITYNVVLRCSTFLLFIAILDYAYKRWDNNRQLKMSKQEVKEEFKQMEGDPFIKGKIKQKQREMAMSRMMQEVPGADVVITNPTHYAVALKYDRAIGHAPVVIAKGKDLVAKKIKQIAADSDVSVIENKPLARTLYATVDLGEYVPPDLFEAVADVLAYVYKLKNRSS